MKTRRSMREAKRLRSRRIRAVLAGGLVLGIGATATLAAWNDSEDVTATFTAGRFDIVGATDGVAFSNHATSGASASLNFLLAPTAMVPGTTTYALFSVKTANPSIAGTLQLTVQSSTGDLATYLRYGVRIVPTAAVPAQSCTAATYAAASAATKVVVPDGSAMTTGGAATTTVPQVVNANGGNQINYCFAVTLPSTADNGAQSKTATQLWRISGTSS